MSYNDYCKRANIRGGFNFAMFAVDDFSAKLKPPRSFYNISDYSYLWLHVHLKIPNPRNKNHRERSPSRKPRTFNTAKLKPFTVLLSIFRGYGFESAPFQSQLTRDLPIIFMNCKFLFILLEDNRGAHTECLNIHVLSVKKKRNWIYRKLIDRPKINKREKRPWVPASRQVFFFKSMKRFQRRSQIWDI